MGCVVPPRVCRGGQEAERRGKRKGCVSRLLKLRIVFGGCQKHGFGEVNRILTPYSAVVGRVLPGYLGGNEL